MDKKYGPGIRPDGAGLRLRIWGAGGKLVYSETVKGDPNSASTIAAAKQRRKWLTARIRLGLPIQEGDEGPQAFEDVAQDYLNTLGAKRSSSMSYENILNRYWLPAYTGWPLSEINTADIKRRLAAIPVGAKTKRNILGPLKGVLAHGEINPNPADAVKVKRGQKAPIDRYTPAERDTLIGKLNGQAAVYFSVLFGCGLRPGEALGLLWTDYSGEELSVSKQITRRRVEQTTKTSTRRTVYVPGWVRPALNDHYTRFEGGYIFQNTQGGPYLDTDAFNAAWRAAHKKARLPYRIPYTCRHTRAAELLSTGVDPADAAKQMGHSVEMFLRTYSEWIEEFSGAKDKRRFEGYRRESVNSSVQEK